MLRHLRCAQYEGGAWGLWQLKHCGALFACVREPAHHSALRCHSPKPGWHFIHNKAGGEEGGESGGCTTTTTTTTTTAAAAVAGRRVAGARTRSWGFKSPIIVIRFVAIITKIITIRAFACAPRAP